MKINMSAVDITEKKRPGRKPKRTPEEVRIHHCEQVKKHQAKLREYGKLHRLTLKDAITQLICLKLSRAQDDDILDMVTFLAESLTNSGYVERSKTPETVLQ